MTHLVNLFYPILHAPSSTHLIQEQERGLDVQRAREGDAHAPPSAVELGEG